MSTIPTPTATPPVNAKEHVKTYASTYLIAGIFVVVTVLQSYSAQFAKYESLSAEQLHAVTDISWRITWSNTLIAAGINILAFLNQTKSRADAKRAAHEGQTPNPFPPR